MQSFLNHRQLIIGLLFLFSISKTMAFNGFKKDSTQWNVGLKSGIGFIMPHHPNMVLLQQGHVKSLELFVEKNTNGSQPWQINYKYPSVGYAFQYFDLGADDLLGSAYAFDVYMKVALINKPNYFIFIKPSFGLGYIEKVYDRIDNNKNVSINSHINAIVQMQGGIQAKLYSRLNLNSTINFTHFSNGAISKPNQGINMPSFNLGLSYGLGNKKLQSLATVNVVKEKYYWISAAATVKQLYPPGGDNYGAYILTAGNYKTISAIWDFGYGLDLTYDTSIKELRKRENLEYENFILTTRAGIHLGLIAKVNKLAALFNIGGYLVNHSPDKEFLYSKLGLRYSISSNWFAGVNLKTHYAKADLLEWHIGYKFRNHDKQE